jgi:hypothetical protein
VHPAASASITSTPTSADGRVDVMPRIVHMLFSEPRDRSQVLG